MLKKFFGWYNHHHQFNLRLAALLFILQIIHLMWLTSNVVILRIFGLQWFPPQLNWLVAAVDYTEIPALISVSFLYINEIFLGKATKKTWLYLFLLNSQWFHLFWITDEVVLSNFTGQAAIGIPVWLAWVAIGIDYLELPVMYDTTKKFILSLRKEP